MTVCNRHSPRTYVLYDEDFGCELCLAGAAYDRLNHRYLAIEQEFMDYAEKNR